MFTSDKKGFVAWFAENHVAANLMMAMILILGAASLISIKQEVFPEMELDMIQISVPYPGATPEEVEEAICTRIEEKISSVDGSIFGNTGILFSKRRVMILFGSTGSPSLQTGTSSTARKFNAPFPSTLSISVSEALMCRSIIFLKSVSLK